MRAGTHWCALYSDPAERERARFAFLREGQRRGDRCVSLVDHLDGALALDHPGVGRTADGHRPAVHRASDVCLRAGQFSADRMTSFLTDRAHRPAETRPPLLRVSVEMGWLLRQPRAVDDLLLYESTTHQAVEQLSAVVMCVYDLPSLGWRCWWPRSGRTKRCSWTAPCW
ncbi:MEDS domain-containing protein [Nocardioides panacis]|uniref:MEDS domain-containing protein n=2 Tax=Nocardioides panacis TaxID=2849501 RepID=A0A975SY33_9ACTN|nr:MEDS domain-containing protein [Nocardioides panacis]